MSENGAFTTAITTKRMKTPSAILRCRAFAGIAVIEVARSSRDPGRWSPMEVFCNMGHLGANTAINLFEPIRQNSSVMPRDDLVHSEPFIANDLACIDLSQMPGASPTGVWSPTRLTAAIESYAEATGYEVVGWFYDMRVRGADPVTERPGFAAMLDRVAGNGARTILVESPDRFACDLAVQLAGHDYLKRLGEVLIPASAPDFFLEDTPTAVLVRQGLGAIAQFDKAWQSGYHQPRRSGITSGGPHRCGKGGHGFKTAEPQFSIAQACVCGAPEVEMVGAPRPCAGLLAPAIGEALAKVAATSARVSPALVVMVVSRLSRQGGDRPSMIQFGSASRNPDTQCAFVQ